MQFDKYKDFTDFCDDYKLSNRQKQWADKMGIAQNSLFGINNEDKDKLWRAYEKYEKLAKKLNSKNNDDIDPHKIASCITLAVLQTRAFTLLSDSTSITKSNIDINQKIDYKILLNELFAIHCGICFLKYTILSNSDDIYITKKIIDLTSINSIIVNRYDNIANETYTDYLIYKLRYLWETTSTNDFSILDIHNLAWIFHHIENHYYSEINKTRLCQSCKKNFSDNKINQLTFCEQCSKAVRKNPNIFTNNIM